MSFGRRCRRCGGSKSEALVATYGKLSIFGAVEDRDENEEAVSNVERITDSEPVNGEDLVESEDLKRKFREAKERLKSELP